MALPTGGTGLPTSKPVVPKAATGRFAPSAYGRGVRPVNLLQAYGNMGGKLPGMTYSKLPSGFSQPGEWAYDGTHPVDLAQAYRNMGGKLPISPAAPSAPSASGGGGTATQPGPPLDATYYQNVADNQFKVNNQINAAQLQESQANTGLQGTLAQLAYQQPRAALALEQQANARGSLYSSAQGQNEGNLAYQFAGKQGAAESNYSNVVDKLSSQIAALRQGVPIYEQGQALASTERAAQLAANNPGTGQPPAVNPGGVNQPAPGAAAPGAPGSTAAPHGYSNPAQQLAAMVAAQKHGGVGTAPKGMPAAGKVLNFNGQHYTVSYDAAGQPQFTRVKGGR